MKDKGTLINEEMDDEEEENEYSDESGYEKH
jgi:hypothetical protein